MKTRSSFETKVLAAFTAAVLVVAGLATTTWKVAQGAAEAAHRVAHTHEVLDSLAQTRADTLQIEFSTQSYRISGDPARLAERDATIATRETLMSQVKQLTGDNARQQERWMRLREVINERLAISRRVEFLRKTQGLEAASAFVASAPLQETRERTYGLLREMSEEERRLLEGRNAEQLRARQSLVAAGALVALLLLALLTATYVLIRRQLRETEASRRALADSEESLSTTLYSIGDAVLATDTEARITRMNPVAEALTGWPFADAQGRPVEEVFHIVNEHTREPAEVPVAKALATGEIQELANHTVLIARDGSERPISDSAAPIRDARGRVGGVVLVFRDVTIAHQAQRTIREQNELLEQRVRERTAQLRESEDHLRSVISNVPAMIAYVDARQRYVYVNNQYRERFAPGQADIAGQTVRGILGDERYAVAAPLIAKVLQGQPQSYDWQPFPGVWQLINYVPRRDAREGVVGYYVLGTDLTERKHTEEKIQTLNAELEQRVRELEHVSRALRTLSAGNRTMLRATDEQGLLDSMCRAIVTNGGYQMASVWYRIDDEFKSLRAMAESGHPGGLDALHQMKGSWADNEYGGGAVASAIRTGQASVVQNILADPNYAPWRPYLPGYACVVACPLRVDGEVIGGLAIYSTERDFFESDEVTLLTESADDLAFGIATLRARAEQQKIQQAMVRLTRYDALTGLPNEAQFAEFLTAAIEAAKRPNRPFAVLQTNVERLSEINDALGFGHGDQLLREFGARLCVAAPASAMAARLRGDEFAILLPDSNANSVITMLQRVEDVLAQPFPVADIALDVSAKIGVALFPQHGATPHDLFRHMDMAVQQAKKKGVKHAIFDPDLNQDQSRRLTMAGELRRAIEGGDLLLYLQPKVEITTGRVCGAEGLVRWKHAERGLIPPGEFIGLAEQTGLIKPLTEWVIKTSLGLNQAWQCEGCALPIAVNLSARNLHDDKLLQTIRHLQTTYGVAAGLLEIEITESAVMDDAEFALRVLHSLRDEGIPLYIDDFGTGYSSLSYLQKLPVEYIKIDQSFVRDMTISKDSSLIVRSTIDLVRDLGRKTVAEGVETREQWDQLAAAGCNIAQGYFIARPMPAEDFQNWVKQFCAPATTPSGKAAYSGQ
ncbi:EAL domain-containing protein [Rhodoferax ferrireducens]|uniref:EAL domain-containing protein n=1 Tax=Rhodoferax ferrireducens TaxID=192843 RepID=UPI003BB6B5AB